MQALTQRLKEKARALGFNMVGVVSAQPARRLHAYLHWIDQEMHGRMGYLARPDRLARRQDLNVILEGVQSVVCVGLGYFTQRIPDEIATDPARGRISNYAWGVDYHDIMTPKLEELGEWLQRETVQQGSEHNIQQRVYVDTGAILERDHAETAGLGFTGKNTMLIAPRSGSWFFLGELLTTLPLVADTPAEPMPSCGKCTRCLTACPTAAFPQPYVLDARRCISYLTIELKGWIPRELRPLMGNWIYGCDICQNVCPFNRFESSSGRISFQAADWDTAAPPLLELLSMSTEAFQERYANSPIKRIKHARFLRNVCVAAGNWGDPAVVAPLQVLLAHADPLVRGHAAWALGQNQSNTTSLLKPALFNETDGLVRDELTFAQQRQKCA